MEPLIVFFSTKSRNTHRFVNKLPYKNIELSHSSKNETIIDQPFVLITPTYGGGHLGGAVPPVIIRFLNEKRNRDQMVGVISTGNRNFGKGFCLAGSVIASKCDVPELAQVEVFGTREDVDHVITAIDGIFQEETDVQT